MATVSQRETLDDLMRAEGKAELISGRIVQFMGTGFRPGRIAGFIHYCLYGHELQSRQGRAFTDNVIFAVPELPSGRESFCPDVAFFTGQPPTNPMRFVEGPPTFAVEVRSENGYGPAAERDIAAKRADYFAAGTLVVWDVDPLAETIDCYVASNPATPRRFQRGQTADAEPAVPGWRVSVDAIFDVT